MSTFNHVDTAIAGVSEMQAADLTVPLGALDSSIGDRSTLTTADATALANNISLVTAIRRIYTSFTASIASIVADSWVTALRIAPSAVTAAKLDAATVTAPGIFWDPYGAEIPPGVDFNGRVRWTGGSGLSRITNDATNPYGGITLRHLGTASGTAAKRMYPAEMGIQVGETVRGALVAKSAAGTYRLSLTFVDSGGSVISTVSSVTTTMTGAIQTLTTAETAIPANTVYIQVTGQRMSGSNDTDWYALYGGKGAFLPSLPAPTQLGAFAPSPNIVWDPLNVETISSDDHWGGIIRYYNQNGMTYTDGDADNPYGGRTLIGSGDTGKYISIAEAGAAVGDLVSFATLIKATGAGTYKMDIQFRTTAYVQVGSTVSSATVAPTATTLLSVSGTVPATAAFIRLTHTQVSGSDTLKIFGTWGSVGGYPGAGPTPAAVPSNQWQFVREMAPERDSFGRSRMRDWQAKIANINAGVASSQAKVLCIGDSWFQLTPRIYGPLSAGLRALYGDAGEGFISIRHGSQAGSMGTWNLTKAGTWVDVDESALALGADISHSRSSDTATPGSLQLTVIAQTLVIHYYKDPTAGSFRYRVDAGGWTTVNAAGTLGLNIVTISGLSNASHVLDIEIVTQGTLPGVQFLGIDAQKTANGVRVDKLGNGSSETSDWLLPSEATWTAAMAALTPNVIVLCIGVNDRTASVVPHVAFANNVRTIVQRCRVAAPAADVVILSFGDIGNDMAYVVQLYDSALRYVASVEKCAYVSGYMNLQPYSTANGRGLMADSQHVNDAGGTLLANRLIGALFRVA